MEKAKFFIKDAVKLLCAGLAASAASFLLLFLGGLVFRQGSVRGGLEAAKTGTLLAASLCLFLLAGMFLIRGKKREGQEPGEGWRRHFQVAGMKTAAGMTALSFLAAAQAADWLLMRL